MILSQQYIYEGTNVLHWVKTRQTWVRKFLTDKHEEIIWKAAFSIIIFLAVWELHSVRFCSLIDDVCFQSLWVRNKLLPILGRPIHDQEDRPTGDSKWNGREVGEGSPVCRLCNIMKQRKVPTMPHLWANSGEYFTKSLLWCLKFLFVMWF